LYLSGVLKKVRSARKGFWEEAWG